MQLRKKSWNTVMKDVGTLSTLLLPTRRTVWSLEIGTVTFSVQHQPKPVTPNISRTKPQSQREVTETWDTRGN